MNELLFPYVLLAILALFACAVPVLNKILDKLFGKFKEVEL
jgi:hypothetical protein